MNRFLLSVLLCSVAFASGAAEVPVELETFVRAAHEAYAANDLPRVTSFWSDSPERAFLELRLRGDYRAHCVEVQSFTIDAIEAGGEKATARTTAWVRRVSRLDGRASERLESRTWSLERVNEAWRVARWRTEEQQVVDELIAAGADDAAFARVLAANARAVGPSLVEEIVTTIDERVVIFGKYERPLGRNVMSIADAVGDPASRALAITTWVESTRTPAPERRPIARAALRKAVALAEEAGDFDAEASALGFLAILEMDDDESSAEAERLIRRILDHEAGVRRDRIIHLALTNLGGCLLARQDYAGAYAAFSEATERNPPDAQFSMYYIGQIHERQNDPELALQYYVQALDPKIARHGPTTIFSHLGLANVHRTRGDLAASREHQRRAVELARADKRPGLIARAVIGLAESHVRDGEYERAAELLDEAIRNAVAVAALAPHIDALLALGRIHLLLGRSDEALRIAGEVLTISDTLDFPGYERYAALMLRGRAHRARGDEAQAVESFATAIARLEAVRGRVAGAERQRRLFFEPFSGGYVEMVDLLLRQDRVSEALMYAERGKGRVLLDALRSGRGSDAPPPSVADRDARESRLATLRGLNRKLIEARARVQVDAAAIVAIEEQLRRAQADLDAFEDALAVRYPPSRQEPAAALDDAALRRLVQRADVAYAEFVVHDRATFLFILRRAPGGGPSIAVHRLVIDRAALEKRVTELVRRLESRDLDWREESRALYDLLLAPAAASLRGVNALGIVPDGALWRLPFEALVAADGKFLVERAACFYAPSLAVLDRVESRRPRERMRDGETLLAFGNPRIAAETHRAAGALRRDLRLTPLPEAEAEVRGIARVYGADRSRVYVGESAVEERAKELMSEASVVHFATHGLLDDGNPMYSQLVLARGAGSAEDGVLQAWEMMRLDIGADLVVLSACDTARGGIGAGEGLIGMSWALFAGGCPSTVATLWKIGSVSSSDLMVLFHQELARRRGQSYAKAEALRAAQLGFIRDARRRHPFYWSAFVLVGSPR